MPLLHVPIAARLESARRQRTSGLGFNSVIKGSRPGSASTHSPLNATYALPGGESIVPRTMPRRAAAEGPKLPRAQPKRTIDLIRTVSWELGVI